MLKLPKKTQRFKQQGALLIEVLISVLIFSIGILALVGLQGVMLKNTMTSEFRAEAAYLAEKRVGEMWADPGNLNAFVDASPVAISDLPGGMRQVTLESGATYKVTVGWTSPGETQEAQTIVTCGMNVAHCYSTVATIAGG